MNQRLLVFGGGGFVVGNLLALALRDGWEVHVADAAVREAHPAAAIVRISLVLGFPITDGSSFIAGLEKKLCRTRFEGVLHLGSTDSVDRFTLTRRAAVMMGFDASLDWETSLRRAVERRPGDGR